MIHIVDALFDKELGPYSIWLPQENNRDLGLVFQYIPGEMAAADEAEGTGHVILH